MPAIFIKQNKPNINKSFFQNYQDHVKYLGETAKTARKDADFNSILLARLKMFDPLYDGYDYFDELVGATAVPLVATIASIGLVIYSIKEILHALAIGINLVEDDNINHLEIASACTFAAIVIELLALAICLKSMISLITRPMVTAFQGFKPQETVRFHNEDSVVGKLTNGTFFDSIYDSIKEQFSTSEAPSPSR